MERLIRDSRRANRQRSAITLIRAGHLTARRTVAHGATDIAARADGMYARATRLFDSHRSRRTRRRNGFLRRHADARTRTSETAAELHRRQRRSDTRGLIAPRPGCGVNRTTGLKLLLRSRLWLFFFVEHLHPLRYIRLPLRRVEPRRRFRLIMRHRGK